MFDARRCDIERQPPSNVQMLKTTTLAISVVLAVVGCGSDDSGGADAAVSGASPFLVDARGFTLYTNDKDTAAAVVCVDGCAQIWIPAAAAQGNDAKLTTFTRPDGTVQAAYDGKPLYTFAYDQAAGDRGGDGVTDAFGTTTFVWTAARRQGTSTPPSGSDGSDLPPDGSDYPYPGY
jgi:predicted lipoprotein with Yx(FWY)xxD motif